MEALTNAVAPVLMLHTVTSSVTVGHVCDMTALGGSANPAVKGTAQAQMLLRLKAARPIMAPLTVRAAAAAAAAAAAVAAAAAAVAAAAAAAMMEAQQHLLEMAGVKPLAGTLAQLVQALPILDPVQQQGGRCCLLRATSFDAES